MDASDPPPPAVPEPDRGRGLVTFAGELPNQRGQVVITVALAAYLHMRPRPRTEERGK